VNVEAAQPESPSLRYWKAAISSLTPEKRDAAWEFYLRHLAAGNTGDTLSALVLLMEANGVFLERLPERYHEELILPLQARLVSLQERISLHEKHQREITAALECVSQRNLDASTRALTTANKVEGSLRDAATAVDARVVVEGVKKQIMDGAVMPMVRATEELAVNTARIDEATKCARNAVESWRKVHLGGIVLNCFLLAFLCAAIVTGIVWLKLDARYEHRLAAEVHRLSATDDTYRQLLMHGISFRLERWMDRSGKPVKDGYAILVDDAEETGLDVNGDRKRAFVLVKSGPVIKRAEAVTREFEELKK
jgi:hypothetical protein